MEFKNKTSGLSLDCGVNENIKIKEEVNETSSELQKEVQRSEYFSVKDVKKGDVKYCAIKVEIKQEPLHLNEPSNEIESELKHASISNEVSCMDFGVMKIDIKQEPLHLNESSNDIESEQQQLLICDPMPWTVEVPPLKETRLESESVCSSSEEASCFFTHVDPEKNSLGSNDKQASETEMIQHYKTYTCSICWKSFSLLSELKEHSVSHMGKSTFKCEICEKSFTRLVSLKHHILIIHEGKRPYSCDICGQSFTQASHLKNHKLRHEGKRPYVCGTCDKSFTTKSQVKRHATVHDDNRPYACDICNKAFTIPYKLKRHQSTHDGKRLQHLLK